MKNRGFRERLRERGIDAALIFSYNNRDPNLSYFTKLPLEYSFLIIPKKGNSVLVTSKLEYERAKRYSAIGHVIRFGKPAFASVASHLGSARTIGINKSVVSMNEYRVLKKNLRGKKFIDIERMLKEHRKAKQPDEVATIRRACKITDEIFAKMLRKFTFRTELEIVAFLRHEAESHGCTLSFDPIVASGRNSSMPHYRGMDVTLKRGFCVIDYGIEYHGYKSDITRTIYLGKATAHEKRMYQLLLDIQTKAIAYITCDMAAEALAVFVRHALGEFDRNFIHGLGHGIGVEIHELPNISAGSKDLLQEGDIFTIEPGIYFPGTFGIRIEDDVLIQNGRVHVLTHARKDLIEVKR